MENYKLTVECGGGLQHFEAGEYLRQIGDRCEIITPKIWAINLFRSAQNLQKIKSETSGA